MKFVLIHRVRPGEGDEEGGKPREGAKKLIEELTSAGIAVELVEAPAVDGVGFELYGEIALSDALGSDVAAARRQIESRHAWEDHRPWGYYQVLADEPDHKVKRIVVYPGKRLSLQRHRRRSEHWHVLWGEALVSRADEEIRLGPGESVDIGKGQSHRVMNPGTTEMAFIEVQHGDYFGEDDIERLEDDFGRA